LTVNPPPPCTGHGPRGATRSARTRRRTCAGPAGNFGYLWSPGGETTQCIDVSPSTTTTYSLVVTDLSTQCSSAGCPYTLTVNPPPPCDITGPSQIADGEVASLCGPDGDGFTYKWSPGGQTTQCIQTTEPGTYYLTVTDANGCSSKCSHTLELVQCACNTGYPDSSNPPRSLVVFNESTVLRAFDPGPVGCGSPSGTIKLWYNDEHALTLGVRRVIVKTSGGTTTTDYPVTPTPSSPTCVDHPQVGTQIATGDQSGNDVAAGGGRPLWPALFITDLTVNGADSRIGDWQQGGTGVAPHRVCGTWKAAVRTVDKTRTPNVGHRDAGRGSGEERLGPRRR
jgi:hypothetical protein